MSTKHPNLAAALIAAQQTFTPVIKDNRANTGKFSYTYADLGSVLEAVTPALHANGLVISQCMQADPPSIETVLLHADSPQEMHSYTPIVWADKTDPQKFGGGITYARRYALMAMLNLNAEDDDGQHARQPAPAREPTPIKRPEFPKADPWTGEIDEEAEKQAILKQIFAIAGKLNVKDEALKERMRQEFMPLMDAESFSRKMLSLDQLTEMKDKMSAALKKAEANAKVTR